MPPFVYVLIIALLALTVLGCVWYLIAAKSLLQKQQEAEETGEELLRLLDRQREGIKTRLDRLTAATGYPTDSLLAAVTPQDGVSLQEVLSLLPARKDLLTRLQQASEKVPFQGPKPVSCQEIYAEAEVYNRLAEDYNRRLASFPASLAAKSKGLTPLPLLSVTGGDVF